MKEVYASYKTATQAMAKELGLTVIGSQGGKRPGMVIRGGGGAVTVVYGGWPVAHREIEGRYRKAGKEAPRVDYFGGAQP